MAPRVVHREAHNGLSHVLSRRTEAWQTRFRCLDVWRSSGKCAHGLLHPLSVGPGISSQAVAPRAPGAPRAGGVEALALDTKDGNGGGGR